MGDADKESFSQFSPGHKRDVCCYNSTLQSPALPPALQHCAIRSPCMLSYMIHIIQIIMLSYMIYIIQIIMLSSMYVTINNK